MVVVVVTSLVVLGGQVLDVVLKGLDPAVVEDARAVVLTVGALV